ncbi:hypothetical protein KCU61_g455, partial [Aureobasidium melanogenum]
MISSRIFGAYTRLSWPRVFSPASKSIEPHPGTRTSVAETLRYLDGKADPVPKVVISTSFWGRLSAQASRVCLLALTSSLALCATPAAESRANLLEQRSGEATTCFICFMSSMNCLSMGCDATSGPSIQMKAPTPAMISSDFHSGRETRASTYSREGRSITAAPPPCLLGSNTMSGVTVSPLSFSTFWPLLKAANLGPFSMPSAAAFHGWNLPLCM